MRTFDQESAKAYLIDLIITQARRDGVSLSEAERYNLAWSESEPGSRQKAEMDAQLEQQTTPEEYEKKIEGIIKRAYKTAIESSPDGKRTFKEAYRVLSKGDHYILVMLREALGMRLQAWWPF